MKDTRVASMALEAYLVTSALSVSAMSRRLPVRTNGS